MRNYGRKLKYRTVKQMFTYRQRCKACSRSSCRGCRSK